jgi:hypothetical protein
MVCTLLLATDYNITTRKTPLLRCYVDVCNDSTRKRTPEGACGAKITFQGRVAVVLLPLPHYHFFGFAGSIEFFGASEAVLNRYHQGLKRPTGLSGR